MNKDKEIVGQNYKEYKVNLLSSNMTENLLAVVWQISWFILN